MNLTQFLLILNARKRVILSIMLFTVITTTVVTLLLPKEYTASATLVFDSKSKDPFTGQLYPVQLIPGYMATQIDIVQSRPVVDKVIEENKLISQDTREQFMSATKGKGNINDWLANLLGKKLDVEPARESNTFTLSFTASDPQFAALMANSFAKAYIQTSLNLKIDPAKQTAEWYDQQISQLRDRLEKAQAKLSAFQRENGMVESDERLDTETRRLSELAGQVVAAQSSAVDANSRARESSALPDVINNSVVQNLKVQLAQDESKMADLASKVGPHHPDYQSLQAEIESIQKKLSSEMKTAERGLTATASAAKQRETSLIATYQAQKEKMLSLKNQHEQMALLASDVENAQHVYDAALQRYGQTRMESQSNQTDVAVLSPAITPVNPSKPKTILNISISVFMGLMLGVAFAYLFEMLDRRVRSGLDIAGELGIPVLCELNPSRPRFAFISRMFPRSRLSRA